MNIVRNIIEFVFSGALFFNALLFIPQFIRIFKEKSAKAISLTTFIGFLLIQIAVILHGIITSDYILIVGYFFSLVTCGSVVFLAIIYRKNKPSIETTDISFEEILTQLPGHIYWKDKNGAYLGSNNQQKNDFPFKFSDGYSGKTDFDLFSNEDAKYLRTVDLEVMRTGKLKIIEEPSSAPDGQKSLYLSYKMPLKNKQDEIIGIIGTSLDITSAKQNEMNRLEMLENIIAVMPGNVYWMNKDGIYLGCNNNEAISIGLNSRKEIVGKRNIDIPGFVIPEILDPINKKVINSGETVITEEPAILPDGTKAIFLSNKVPLRNNNGEVTGMVGISIDITDRKDLQKKLHEAELKEKLHEEKLLAMKALAASIAHELRTPLLSIYNVSAIKDFFPELITSYEMAKKAGLPVPFMRTSQLEVIKNAFDILERETNYANAIINLSLNNIKELNISRKNFKPQKISDCINAALDHYPFSPETEKKLISFESTNNDFMFMGDNMLVNQVFVNLVKNALYFIKKAGKGQIYIWSNSDEKFNRLYFKDTGYGIDKEVLPHIFDHFFSKTDNGTGIGLAYCRMVMQNMDGEITCESVFGEYAKFILQFPKLEEVL